MLLTSIIVDVVESQEESVRSLSYGIVVIIERYDIISNIEKKTVGKYL